MFRNSFGEINRNIFLYLSSSTKLQNSPNTTQFTDSVTAMSNVVSIRRLPLLIIFQCDDCADRSGIKSKAYKQQSLGYMSIEIAFPLFV